MIFLFLHSLDSFYFFIFGLRFAIIFIKNPSFCLRLEIIAPFTKVLCINTTLDAPLTIAGETLLSVDSFTYLGSVISNDGNAQEI